MDGLLVFIKNLSEPPTGPNPNTAPPNNQKSEFMTCQFFVDWGYRLVDTAALYNNEESVGEACVKQIPVRWVQVATFEWSRSHPHWRASISQKEEEEEEQQQQQISPTRFSWILLFYYLRSLFNSPFGGRLLPAIFLKSTLFQHTWQRFGSCENLAA